MHTTDFIIENGVLTKYKGPGGDVVVPDGVTQIGARAFARCGALRNLHLPGSVTVIEKEAFKWCLNMKTLDMGACVTDLGPNVLWNCAGLTRITAPGIPLDRYVDPEHKYAAVLSFIENPEGYTNPAVVKSYHDYLLSHRKKILPDIFRADAVGILPLYAEHNTITVKNFMREFMTPALDANATACAAYLLNWKHENLSEEEQDMLFELELTKDPFHVEEMQKLWRYTVLRDTVILTGYKGDDPNVSVPPRIGSRAVAAIGKNAFTWNADLTGLHIADGVTKIDDCAFFACQNLTNAYIPDSVTEIGESAFAFCKKLTLCAPAGSYAEAYAKENGIPFHAL